MDFDSRKALVEGKAAQTQAELTEWAAATHLLQAGERIVFTMRIENVPAVVAEAVDANPLLDLSLTQFFTWDRLNNSGGNVSTNHSIASNMSGFDLKMRESEQVAAFTVRMLIERFGPYLDSLPPCVIPGFNTSRRRRCYFALKAAGVVPQD